MATVAINDLVLYSIRGFIFDQRIISTYGYRVEEITGTPDYVTVMNEFLAAMAGIGKIRATYIQCCAPEYFLEQAWAQRIAPNRVMTLKQDVDLDGLFVDGKYSTANVSAAITRRGIGANRSNVSTLHVPIGQSIDEIDDGKVSIPLDGALNVHAAQIPLQVTTATGSIVWQPVIPFAEAPGSSVDIITAFVQDTVRVMRRRTVRLGE